MNPFTQAKDKIKKDFTDMMKNTSKSTPVASASATSPIPTSGTTQVGPTRSSIPSSPKQNYINTVVKPTTSPTPNYYDVNTGLLTDAGKAAGMKEVNTPKVETPKEPTASTTQSNAYLDYLKTLFNPEQAKIAQQNITSLNERIAAETKRSRDEEERIRANEKGGLALGQNYALSELERKSSRTLADLALAKGSATDILSTITGAGKSAYELDEPIEVDGALYQKQADGTYKVVAGTPGGTSSSSAGFTLSPGETRYDAQGNVLASGGPKPPTATQEAAAQAKTEKEIAAQQSATQSIGIVNNLLSNDRYKSISGGLQPGSIPFFGDRKAVNEYDQLQGLLKLGIRGLIKGQGAVSDYEGKILGQAASSLSRLTDEDTMKQGLLQVRGVLKTNNGQTTTVDVTNPNTGEVIKDVDLSGSEIYQLVSEGNVITYK